MEEKVEVIKDVSSDPEVMNNQDETAKVGRFLRIVRLDLYKG
jgi:lipopolysaccharide/colanic/teichoic acid biosynthesis glycosyltransferase